MKRAIVINREVLWSDIPKYDVPPTDRANDAKGSPLICRKCRQVRCSHCPWLKVPDWWCVDWDEIRTDPKYFNEPSEAIFAQNGKDNGRRQDVREESQTDVVTSRHPCMTDRKGPNPWKSAIAIMKARVLRNELLFEWRSMWGPDAKNKNGTPVRYEEKPPWMRDIVLDPLLPYEAVINGKLHIFDRKAASPWMKDGIDQEIKPTWRAPMEYYICPSSWESGPVRRLESDAGLMRMGMYLDGFWDTPVEGLFRIVEAQAAVAVNVRDLMSDNITRLRAIVKYRFPEEHKLDHSVIRPNGADIATIPTSVTPMEFSDRWDARYGNKRIFIMDTGSSCNVLNYSVANEAFNWAIRMLQEKMEFDTANSSTSATKGIRGRFAYWDRDSDYILMKHSPELISVGERCHEAGFTFIWVRKKNPCFISPDGKWIIIFEIDNFIPIWCPRFDTEMWNGRWENIRGMHRFGPTAKETKIKAQKEVMDAILKRTGVKIVNGNITLDIGIPKWHSKVARNSKDGSVIYEGSRYNSTTNT